MEDKILVIDKNPGVADTLTVIFNKDMPDAILVNTSRRTLGKNLEKAIGLVKLDKPMILYSFENLSWFNQNLRFHYLLGHRNCGFIRVPENLDKVKQEYDEIKLAINFDLENDELCLSLLEITIDLQEEKSFLRHDLASTKKSLKKLTRWLKKARKMGYVGSDKEIVAAVQAGRAPNSYKPFAGRYFSGLFIDLEDTLFVEGEINPKVWDFIERKRVPDSKITLWTGDDLEKMARLCRLFNIPWKVLPKQIFREARVEKAIDNEPDELSAEYKIRADQIFSSI